MDRARSHQNLGGFSFIELLITLSVLAILSSVALANLSSSWSKARLVSTTRALENWLSEQRRQAMSQNHTYRICIDENNKKLFSSIYSITSEMPVSCSDISADSKIGIFGIDDNFGSGYENLTFKTCTANNKKVSAILLSHQGFSNDIVSDDSPCEEEAPTEDGVVEIRLRHPDQEEQRCIRIISPIGMIRDGSTEGASTKCRYDNTY